MYVLVMLMLYSIKMAPRGQKLERRQATTWRDDTEANWNRRTDRQTDRKDHVWSQADALTKNSYLI